MRDYNHSGDNFGTVNINDNSVVHKPLAQCTSPELREEQIIRKKKEDKESADIGHFALRYGLPLGMVMALTYIIMSLSKGMHVNPSIVMALLVAGPLATGGLRYKVREEIINRHAMAQREIKLLLGERGEE